jgi:hypothetical protein
VFLLEVREGFDDAERFGFVLDDGFGSATRNNEDIELSEPLHGALEVSVSSEGGSLGGDGVLFFGGEDGFKSFGCWRERYMLAYVCEAGSNGGMKRSKVGLRSDRREIDIH